MSSELAGGLDCASAKAMATDGPSLEPGSTSRHTGMSKHLEIFKCPSSELVPAGCCLDATARGFYSTAPGPSGSLHENKTKQLSSSKQRASRGPGSQSPSCLRLVVRIKYTNRLILSNGPVQHRRYNGGANIGADIDIAVDKGRIYRRRCWC